MKSKSLTCMTEYQGRNNATSDVGLGARKCSAAPKNFNPQHDHNAHAAWETAASLRANPAPEAYQSDTSHCSILYAQMDAVFARERALPSH